MAHIQHISDDSFRSEVIESTVPVLVDFWAPWCGPCRMVAPVIEAIAEKMDGKVKFVKLNTDENQKTAIDYQIMGIPTLLIFKDGQEAERIVGFRPQQEIESVLNNLVSA